MFKQLLFASSAFPLAVAWGVDGHATIADLGSYYFTDKAKNAVNEIMGEGTRIADYASWADNVRNGPDAENWKWSSGLHFVNVDDCHFIYEKDCKEDRCVVGAIKNYTNQAVDKSLPIERRQEALKFLTHFLGDVHQPLHAGGYEDLGGNTIKVQMDFADKPFGPIHKTWDTKLIDQYESERYPGDYVQSDFDHDMDRTRFWTITKDQLAGELQEGGKYHGKIAEWTSDCEEHGLDACLNTIVQETVDTACAKAYKHVNGKDVLNEDVLPFEYYEDRINTVMEQLAKAAIRYAWVMNNAFAESDLECDDYCDSVLSGSYCKYWQTIPVCQGNDIPCRCSVHPVAVRAL